MTIDINELTIGQLNEIARLTGCSARKASKPSGDFTIGETVLIRTVTFFHTGRVIRESRLFVWLEDAAWIADTGRFHEALSKGTLNEIEPVAKPIRIGKGSIVDVLTWEHALPRTAK